MTLPPPTRAVGERRLLARARHRLRRRSVPHPPLLLCCAPGASGIWGLGLGNPCHGGVSSQASPSGFCPMILLTGGPDRLLARVGRPGAREDLGNNQMLLEQPRPRLGGLVLRRLVAPGPAWPVAALTLPRGRPALCGGAGGSAHALCDARPSRSRRISPSDFLFQENLHSRYALPLVVADA